MLYAETMNRIKQSARLKVYVALALCLAACSPKQMSKGLVEHASAGVTDEVASGRRLALFIGIDASDDGRFADLRFAGADATALANALWWSGALRRACRRRI
jgi:hypothetical protein